MANAPASGTEAGQSIIFRFSGRMICPASRLTTAAAYWFLGGGGGGGVLVNLRLSQKVKTPDTKSAMMKAEVSLREFTLHLYRA